MSALAIVIISALLIAVVLLGSLRVGQRADPHPPGDIRVTERGRNIAHPGAVTGDK